MVRTYAVVEGRYVSRVVDKVVSGGWHIITQTIKFHCIDDGDAEELVCWCNLKTPTTSFIEELLSCGIFLFDLVAQKVFGYLVVKTLLSSEEAHFILGMKLRTAKSLTSITPQPICVMLLPIDEWYGWKHTKYFVCDKQAHICTSKEYPLLNITIGAQ